MIEYRSPQRQPMACRDFMGGVTFTAPDSARFGIAVEQFVPAASCHYVDGSWLIAATWADVALLLFRSEYPDAPLYAPGESPAAQQRYADAEAALAHHAKEAA